MTGQTVGVPRSTGPIRLLLGAAGLVLPPLLTVGCGGAGTGDRSAPPNAPDPCALVTDDLLDRLAPGGVREPEPAASTDDAINRSCGVDLTGTPDPDRGDLSVSVSVSASGEYDDGHRTETCAEIGSEPSAAGPGDAACLALVPDDGVQTRIDGYAWIGDDRRAEVHLQLVETEVPATAEADLGELLAAAIASFPDD